MNDLNSINVFIEVVKTKSFSAAARNLKVQKSTISRKIAALEDLMGIQLINRTTRQVIPTRLGKKYFDQVQIHLAEIQKSTLEIQNQSDEIQGHVKITAPIDLGSMLLPPVIADFKKQYPQVKVEVLLEDKIVDFVADNIDIAIRAGKLVDSSLKLKKIRAGQFGLFSSPIYLKNLNLKHPKDISTLDTINFIRPAGDFDWCITNGDQRIRIKTKSDLKINHLETIREILKNGWGISLLPTLICQEYVKAGKLIHLFPNWHAERTELSMLYSNSKFLSPAVKLLLDFLYEKLKD